MLSKGNLYFLEERKFVENTRPETIAAELNR